MEDLTNIWNADDEINEEQLLNYIKGESPEDEQYAVEKQMTGSDFVNEAIEGLQQFEYAGKLDEYVYQLNKKLHQHLASHKQQKEKRKIKDLSWIIVAVIIILLLCVLGYLVIKMKSQ